MKNNTRYIEIIIREPKKERLKVITHQCEKGLDVTELQTIFANMTDEVIDYLNETLKRIKILYKR